MQSTTEDTDTGPAPSRPEGPQPTNDRAERKTETRSEPGPSGPAGPGDGGGNDPPPPSPPPPPPPSSAAGRARVPLELIFGTRLPVWVGAIALSLAGYFLVKYSIEQNLLGPALRVLLGGALGLTLLAAGQMVRLRPQFANGARIAQALSGAGISILYVSLFAATSLYHLISPLWAFLGMAATTGIAVLLSMRQGPPIAVLGLVGGFITPLLIDAPDPSAALLFLYLYLVFAGLIVVIRQRDWWWLSLPLLAASFVWVSYWLASHYSAGDSLWLGLFLLAVCGTIAAATRGRGDEESIWFGRWHPAVILNFVGMAGALALAGVTSAKAGFGWLDWGLFGLLTAGGLGLAAHDAKRYGVVPWMALIVNIAMMVAWQSAAPADTAIVLASFAVLFIGSGSLVVWRGSAPLSWAGLVCASAVGYFLLAYLRLESWPALASIPLFWGGLAMLAAAITTVHSVQARRRLAGHPHEEYVLALLTTIAIGFTTLAFGLELDRDYLSVAIAAQVFAVAWVSTKIEVRTLRPIVLGLTALFGMLLLPQVALLLELTAYSLIETRLHLQVGIPIVDWPLFQLGLPSVFLFAAASLLRKREDDALVRGLEIASVALITIMGYYVIRHAFHFGADVIFVKAGFLERGLVTNGVFGFGLLCLLIGRRFEREALTWCGVTLGFVALFRLVYFDLLLLNPLWANQSIDGWPLLNSLFITYGLPVLWTWQLSRELELIRRNRVVAYLKGFMLLLVFVLVSFNVRQLFHGASLQGGYTGNAEIYSYSVAWLLTGLALLFAGIWRRNTMLRYASLGLMVLTVAKVFLYDGGQLEGLYRVFSFLGLGISLLGLSYFYSRFVFGRRLPEGT